MVAAHEIIHEVYRKKESGIILKLDYEKTYDRVSWSFLEEMLKSRGFGAKWRGWIEKVVQGGGGPFVLELTTKIAPSSNQGRGCGKGIPFPPTYSIWLLMSSLGCS